MRTMTTSSLTVGSSIRLVSRLHAARHPRSMSHRGHRESMNRKIEVLCRNKVIGNRDSRTYGDLRSRDNEAIIFIEHEEASSKSRKFKDTREIPTI